MNCSTFNPCGRFGYCINDKEGNWSCECKFWWNGTTCNEHTNSGIQVITLGCLLGALLIILYTLKIVRCLHNKKKYPKKEKPKLPPPEKKLINLALEKARRSARLTALVTTIFMMIVAAGSLLAKWGIIQPIHDEIVRKYQLNQTISFTPNRICEITNAENFNLVTFPVACFLVVVFSIRSKRTSFHKDKCRGFGAAAMPIDFLSHIDRKFAAVVFAICADELIAIFQEAFTGGGKTGEGVLIVYLHRLTQVLIMGIRYYPFLAAVYMNTTMTLVLASIYAWYDFAFTIVNQGMCIPDFYPTDDDAADNSSSITTLLDYYGTGPSLVAIQLCLDIPRYCCLAYISVKLPFLFVRKLYFRFKKDLSAEKRMLLKMSREDQLFYRISQPNSVQMLYLRNLFRGPENRIRSESFMARIIPKFIYEWRDDFQFSARVTCVFSSLALLIYFLTIQAFVRIIPELDSLEKLLQLLIDAISSVFLPPLETEPTGGDDSTPDPLSVTPTQSNFPLPKLIRPYIFAVFITFFLIVFQLCVLLANIRRNLLQAFRGDDSEIPRRARSRFPSYASGNVHFAGYFIGYLIWGFILIAFFSALICFAIEAFITFGSVRLVEKVLKKIIPSLLFVFFKKYLNLLLAQYVFLQHYGEVAQLNNRRALMIFIYFNFFLDAFLGFISSIIRLIKSVIGGILYMCRLDYSPLGRKLETFDSGFSAYCGFIHTECTHRHPVLLVFVSYLYRQIKFREIAFENDESSREKNYLVTDKRRSLKYQHKWKLAAFLIRNPSIVFFRKAFLKRIPPEEAQQLNENDLKKNAQRRLSFAARRMSILNDKEENFTLHEKF